MADTKNERLMLTIKLKISEGSYKEALQLIERISAPSLEEEEAQKLVLAGQSFEGLNDVASAREAYSRAQSLAPAFSAPILREGVLRYRRGDLEGARSLLYRYVERESGNPEAFYYLVLCEPDERRKAAFIRKVAILDGPTGTWSKELLRSFPPG
jgi:Flp pilus assembly protein TadD